MQKQLAIAPKFAKLDKLRESWIAPRPLQMFNDRTCSPQMRIEAHIDVRTYIHTMHVCAYALSKFSMLILQSYIAFRYSRCHSFFFFSSAPLYFDWLTSECIHFVLRFHARAFPTITRWTKRFRSYCLLFSNKMVFINGDRKNSLSVYWETVHTCHRGSEMLFLKLKKEFFTTESLYQTNP